MQIRKINLDFGMLKETEVKLQMVHVNTEQLSPEQNTLVIFLIVYFIAD